MGAIVEMFVVAERRVRGTSPRMTILVLRDVETNKKRPPQEAAFPKIAASRSYF
jgi:hypothetical protein